MHAPGNLWLNPGKFDRVGRRLRFVQMAVMAILIGGISFSADSASATQQQSKVAQSSMSAREFAGSKDRIANGTPKETSALIEKADWEEDAMQVLGELQMEFPDSYSEALFISDSLEVRFAGQAPAAALELLSPLKGHFTVAEDATLSKSERADLTYSVAKALESDIQANGLTAIVSYESDEQNITVSVAGSDENNKPTIEPDAVTGRVNEVLDGLDLGSLKTTVVVDLNEYAADSTSYNQAGGTRLNFISNGAAACTSGFVVKKNSNPDLGILTAGHCGNDLRQTNVNGYPNFNFVFGSQHIGPLGDFQFMRSPVMMDPWFHYSEGLGKPVTATGAAAVGQQVCRYGRVSDDGCFTVLVSDVSWTSESGTAGHLVRVNSDRWSQRGDSGGPVYRGTVAIGLIKGRDTIQNVGYYSDITWALNNTETHMCFDPMGC